MKLSKNLGRVATTFLATAMLASVSAVPAFATEPGAGNVDGDPQDPPKLVTIQKDITKDVNAYAPNTTFNFSVQPWTGSYEQGDLIQPGPAGGVYFSLAEDGTTKVTTGSIPSTPNPSDVDGQSDDKATAGTTQLIVDEELMKQQAPGIYRYEVTEITPDENERYDGVTYSNETKYFDVYVTIDQKTGVKSVTSYTFVDRDNDKVKDDGIFENGYNDESTGANKTLTVEKELSGLQASPAQEFTFKITINGAEGEWYKIVKTDANGDPEAIPNVTYLTSDTQTSFTLQGGEHITVYGLSPKDTYTVSEEDCTELGYTTTVKVDDADAQTAPTQATISGKEDTVTFINSREATAPTGIVMDIAPYALLVIVAAAGCFVFMRKRRED